MIFGKGAVAMIHVVTIRKTAQSGYASFKIPESWVRLNVRGQPARIVVTAGVFGADSRLS